MSEKLGQVVVNQREEVRVSLHEICGELHVELRVFSCTTPGESNRLLGHQSVSLPVGALPDFLRAMTEAQELLIKRGLIPSSELTIMEHGEPVTLRLSHPKARVECRQHPRVLLTLPMECRLVDSAAFWPGKWMNGEVKDMSNGGAQVWLPERLPLFKQVEVSIVIDGSVFRGRADIVGAELKVKGMYDKQYYRHSLQWVAIDAQARAILSKMVSITKSRSGGGQSPILRSSPSGLESRTLTRKAG
jgi:hypothetical protein